MEMCSSQFLEEWIMVWMDSGAVSAVITDPSPVTESSNTIPKGEALGTSPKGTQGCAAALFGSHIAHVFSATLSLSNLSQ